MPGGNCSTQFDPTTPGSRARCQPARDGVGRGSSPAPNAASPACGRARRSCRDGFIAIYRRVSHLATNLASWAGIYVRRVGKVARIDAVALKKAAGDS